MFFAGIDAHTRYVVVVIINKMGERVAGPDAGEGQSAGASCSSCWRRIVRSRRSWRPAPRGPWLHELLTGAGIHFVLAHARRLRAIAEANYKCDDIDADCSHGCGSPG